MNSILDLLFGGLKKTVEYAQKHPDAVQDTIERVMRERQLREQNRQLREATKKAKDANKE